MFANLKALVGKTLTGHETTFPAIKSFNCLGAVYPSKLSTDQELINRRYVVGAIQDLVYEIESLVLYKTSKEDVQKFINEASACDFKQIPGVYDQYIDKYSDHITKSYTLMLFSFMKIWNVQGREVSQVINSPINEYVSNDYFKVIYSITGDTALIPVLVCINYSYVFASFESCVYARLLADKIQSGEYAAWEELPLLNANLHQSLRTLALQCDSVEFTLPFSHAEYGNDITDPELYFKTGPHHFNELNFGDSDLQAEYNQAIAKIKKP